MIRRSPTRIELKQEDLQEFEVLRQELEDKRKAARVSAQSTSTIKTQVSDAKAKQDYINQRIGYNPDVQT